MVRPSLPPSSDGKAVRSVQEGREETRKHRRKSGRGWPTASALPCLLGSLVLSKWRQVSVPGASLAGYDVSFMDAGFVFFSLHQDSSRGGTLPAFASFTEELTAQGAGPDGRGPVVPSGPAECHHLCHILENSQACFCVHHCHGSFQLSSSCLVNH